MGCKRRRFCCLSSSSTQVSLACGLADCEPKPNRHARNLRLNWVNYSIEHEGCFFQKDKIFEMMNEQSRMFFFLCLAQLAKQRSKEEKARNFKATVLSAKYPPKVLLLIPSDMCLPLGWSFLFPGCVLGKQIALRAVCLSLFLPELGFILHSQFHTLSYAAPKINNPIVFISSLQILLLVHIVLMRSGKGC